MYSGPAKVQSIPDWVAPTTLTQLRTFIGNVAYKKPFNKIFAEICRSLSTLSMAFILRGAMSVGMRFKPEKKN